MPGIDAIFKRDKDGNYTKKALLYQDILEYSLEKKERSGNANSFRHWELAKWLMNHNEEFINHYKDISTRTTTIPNRIENTQRSTKNKLNDLISLQLIRISGTAKAERGNAVVSLYSFTDLGYLLAWIIESNKPQKRRIAIDEVYNLIHSLLTIKEDSPSTTIFYYHFFRNCWEKRVFDKLIQRILNIADSNRAIKNIRELFERLVDLGFKDEKTRKDFWNIWLETIKELDTKTQQFVLHQMKLDVERRFQNKKEYLTSEYEEMRFLYRGDYSRIAVEGSCEKCNLQQGSIMLDILDYREALARGLPTDSIRSQCPLCNTKDSLVIPNFNY